MRLPRDVSGVRLSKRLKSLGYVVTRQMGSHMRLTTTQNGEHHITIPGHDPLRIGTVGSILGDIVDPDLPVLRKPDPEWFHTSGVRFDSP